MRDRFVRELGKVLDSGPRFDNVATKTFRPLQQGESAVLFPNSPNTIVTNYQQLAEMPAKDRAQLEELFHLARVVWVIGASQTDAIMGANK